MKFTFVGKNIVASQEMKDYAIKKLGRLERIFPPDISMTVSFSAFRADNKVEVSVPLNKRLLRAEVMAEDMFEAIDESVDILERQMVKYRKRLKGRSRKDVAFKDEYSALAHEEQETNEEGDILIERMKHFPLKPMDQEEAIMEMEMLGHNFFVFRNSANDEINVVYKRHHGYGLIDPNDPADA